MLERLHLKRSGATYVDAGVGTVTGGGTVRSEGYARHGVTLDERVDYLESQIPKLRHEIADAEQRLEQRVEEAVLRVEEKRRHELRRSLNLEELGVAAFVVGLLMTTLGSVWPF